MHCVTFLLYFNLLFFLFVCICVHVLCVADLSQCDHLHLW